MVRIDTSKVPPPKWIDLAHSFHLQPSYLSYKAKAAAGSLIIKNIEAPNSSSILCYTLLTVIGNSLP